MAIKNKHFYAIQNKRGEFVTTDNDYVQEHISFTVSDVPKRYYDDEWKAQIFANFINDEIGREELSVVEVFPQVAEVHSWDSIGKSGRVLGELYAIKRISTGMYVESDGKLTHELNRADMQTTVQSLKKKFTNKYIGMCCTQSFKATPDGRFERVAKPSPEELMADSQIVKIVLR